MTVSPTYNRVYNFTNFQTGAPATPLPAGQLDAELNSVKVTLDAMLANTALIQRSDGALANGSVTQQSLATSLSIGFTFRGAWKTGTNYNVSDGVFDGFIFYTANLANLSGATHPASDPTNWAVAADFTGSGAGTAAASATAALASQAAALVSQNAASASAAAAVVSVTNATTQATAAAASAAAAAATLSTSALKANNLSDLASASSSRTNLGLGTMATQAASAAAITGGTVDNAVIGGVTPAAGTFTSLTATTISFASGINSTNIGSVTPGTGAFTSLSTTLTAAFGGVLTASAGITISAGGLTVTAGAVALPAASLSCAVFATGGTLGGVNWLTPNGGSTFGLSIQSQNSNPSILKFIGTTGAQVGGITVSSSATTYATSSDADLKTVRGPVDAEGALARINSLRVYEAAFNEEPDAVRPMILAHELQETHPHAVNGVRRHCEPAPVIDKDAPEGEYVIMEQTYQGVDYSHLVVDLIAANQALTRRLAALEAAV